MENMDIFISQNSIQNKVKEIANKIDNDYKDEEVIIISILKGAIYFTMDLVKNINNQNIQLDFMKVSSYKNNIESNNEIDFQLDISIDITNKNIIIVDDILDTGYTMQFLYNHLAKKNPKSIKTCVLLNKPERRIININADYVGFDIKNEFVIGYGLDYDEKYRNLPHISYIKRK